MLPLLFCYVKNEVYHENLSQLSASEGSTLEQAPLALVCYLLPTTLLL